MIIENQHVLEARYTKETIGYMAADHPNVLKNELKKLLEPKTSSENYENGLTMLVDVAVNCSKLDNNIKL